MARKKGKSISFDAMVKFFMKNYSIPTKKDVEMIVARLDRIEGLIKAAGPASKARRKIATSPEESTTRRSKATVSASDMVLDILAKLKKGADFAEIQSKTGFEEKKLRNIIFRLDKLGKIKRLSRGVYGIK